MNTTTDRIRILNTSAVLLSLGLLACNPQKDVSPKSDTVKTEASTLAPTPEKATSGRQHIEIVGSSTVYPFATVVAERFGKASKFKTPKIESTGSGGGLKLFCDGVGDKYPDVANSSRRIKASEVELCNKNGVKEIVEIKIGYDGIVLARSKSETPLQLNMKSLWLALAKDVVDPKDEKKMVPNPFKTWKDVDPSLPDLKIEVLGPPPTSGTRDAFVELALEGGCQEFPAIKELKKTDEPQYKSYCHTIREDGAFVESGENDNLIVQKLVANPSAVGIFGFSFLEQNSEKVQASTVGGVEPTFESIADGKYPISRPLYVYVKKAHVGAVPGIAEYLKEFTSEKAWGMEGYLADKGMIPMPDAERKQFFEAAEKLNPLSL